jgi:hypothetical protein
MHTNTLHGIHNRGRTKILNRQCLVYQLSISCLQALGILPGRVRTGGTTGTCRLPELFEEMKGIFVGSWSKPGVHVDEALRCKYEVPCLLG